MMDEQEAYYMGRMEVQDAANRELEIAESQLERQWNDYGELEQRYKQLEQLTSRMYKALIHCSISDCLGCPFLHDGCNIVGGYVGKEIESLGVVFDD